MLPRFVLKNRESRHRCSWLVAACVFTAALPLTAQTSIRSIKVLGTKDTVEIEVEASDRVVPQTQVVANPDRLVVDFPDAVPGAQLRSQSVDRGDVKDVRVGLWHGKPPVTRVVLDLKSPRSYQVFPYGRTVMIKVTGNAGPAEAANDAPRAGLVAANYTAGSASLVTSPRTALEVSYRNGLLGIMANKATLSEVLYAIQQRTGAEISIPAGAEQERVVAEIDAAPAPEVLARLLNGSRFNFLITSSPNDPRQLARVILTPRDNSAMSYAAPAYAAPAPVQAKDDDLDDDSSLPSQPSNAVPPPPVQAGPIQAAPPPSPDPDARIPENQSGQPQN